MRIAQEESVRVGVAEACRALGLSRATYYRKLGSVADPDPRGRGTPVWGKERAAQSAEAQRQGGTAGLGLSYPSGSGSATDK